MAVGMPVALPVAGRASFQEVQLTAHASCKHEEVIFLKLFPTTELMLIDLPGPEDEPAGQHPSGSSPPSEWTASKPPMGPRRSSSGRRACASGHAAARTSPSGAGSGAAISGTAKFWTLGEQGSPSLTLSL